MQALALATTQQADELVVHGMWEQKAFQQLGGREFAATFQRNPVGNVSDGINDLPIFVEMAAFLRVMPKHHRLAHRPFPHRVGDSQNQLQEGGLARAVLAHQSDAFTAFEMVG